jgi:hypothetical protein
VVVVMRRRQLAQQRGHALVPAEQEDVVGQDQLPLAAAHPLNLPLDLLGDHAQQDGEHKDAEHEDDLQGREGWGGWGGSCCG